MTLRKCLSSRNTCPKYIVHCTFESTLEKDSSELALFDWWSFAHIFWGAMYSLPLFFGIQKIPALAINVGLAIFYEIVENSQVGVWLSGHICCTKHYAGDNFWNSVADVFCCIIGYTIMLLIHEILI